MKVFNLLAVAGFISGVVSVQVQTVFTPTTKWSLGSFSGGGDNPTTTSTSTTSAPRTTTVSTSTSTRPPTTTTRPATTISTSTTTLPTATTIKSTTSTATYDCYSDYQARLAVLVNNETLPVFDKYDAISTLSSEFIALVTTPSVSCPFDPVKVNEISTEFELARQNTIVNELAVLKGRFNFNGILELRFNLAAEDSERKESMANTLKEQFASALLTMFEIQYFNTMDNKELTNSQKGDELINLRKEFARVYTRLSDENAGILPDVVFANQFDSVLLQLLGGQFDAIQAWSPAISCDYKQGALYNLNEKFASVATIVSNTVLFNQIWGLVQAQLNSPTNCHQYVAVFS